MKNKLYNWIWRWHFIGGIISLPIVILLSATGIIYLFKDDYEKSHLERLTNVEAGAERLTYQHQWEQAELGWGKKADALILPSGENKATQFVSGRFSHKTSFLIDPFTGKEKGRIIPKKTDMHKVRKLHGELLLGSYGTKIVELVASWMVVLIITGIYLFWPKGRGLKSLVTIRTKQSKRVFYRDLHAVTGFWCSILLLLILAGGLPWTDVFGSGYKWVQKSTKSGFPKSWQGRNYQSTVKGETLPVDHFVKTARQLNLPGEVSIHLPEYPNSVYSISNTTSKLSSMKMLHFDRYSGDLIKSNDWSDIGLMMRTRLWVMAFHQGQFGTWNFILVMGTAIGLLIMSLAALFSYLKRKTKGNWAIPKSPIQLTLGYGLLTIVCLMGVLLPLFGLSVLIIVLAGLLKKKKAFEQTTTE